MSSTGPGQQDGGRPARELFAETLTTAHRGDAALAWCELALYVAASQLDADPTLPGEIERNWAWQAELAGLPAEYVDRHLQASFELLAASNRERAATYAIAGRIACRQILLDKSPQKTIDDVRNNFAMAEHLLAAQRTAQTPPERHAPWDRYAVQKSSYEAFAEATLTGGSAAAALRLSAQGINRALQASRENSTHAEHRQWVKKYIGKCLGAGLLAASKPIAGIRTIGKHRDAYIARQLDHPYPPEATI